MSWFRQRREKRPKSSTGPSCANTLYPPVGGGAAQSSESLARSRSPSPSPSPTPNSVRIVPVVEHSRDLWKEAFDSLDKDQCDTLQDGASMGTQDAICTVDTVIDLTEREYKDYCTRGWHIKKGDKTKETNVRIRAKEILCSALQFKDIIDRGLKFDPSGYGTIVWGVVSGGLQLLQNDTDRAEAIFDSAAEMAKILPKYAVVEAQYRDWPLQEQAAFEGRIVAVYSALLLYAAEVKKGLDKSFAGKLLASFWSIENQTITSLRAGLTKKNEEATDMLHLVAHQQRKMEFSKLDKKATESLDRMDGVVEKLLEMEKSSILSWLFDAGPSDAKPTKPTKPSDMQHSLRVQVERDNSKSGQWFLILPEFSSWQKEPGSFFWLKGASGCGKSSLCSTIINRLAQSAIPSQAKILAYWYFDNGNPKTQDLRALLRFFLRRIAAVSDVFPPPVRALAAKHESSGSDPEVGELCKTLLETISGLKEDVFIVMDAIDEYPADGTVDRRYDLLTVISDLVKAQLAKLHVFVTSIDERDIHDSFCSFDKPPVELDVEPLLFGDLGFFVDATVERFATSKPWWTDGIKNKIRETLKANDYKRFRIVALQLEDLSKCFDEDEIDKLLNSIPLTVEALYERRLGGVAEKDVPRLRHIFYWISLAGRQLSLRELAAAPGVKLRNPDDIFVICPRGMVRKKEKRDPQPDTNGDGDSGTDEKTESAADLGEVADEIVVFDHPSVKRFLSSQKLFRSKGIASEFFIAEKEAHIELAKLTLEYLLTIRQSQISAVFLESEPFLSYAAVYCILHLRSTAATSADSGQITPLLLDLFGSPMRPGFLNWMRVANPLNPENNFDLRETDCPSPLYAAIELRLQKVADHLIVDGSFINSHGGKHLTALHLALSQKEYTLALRLVEAGANPNESDDRGASPLYSAVRAGAKEVVQKLLISKANIDNKEGKYGNALQLACYLGDLDIVQALFAYKPDVNAEGGLFGTALQAASAIGHKDIVAMLLEKKARSDTSCGLLGSAIQAAVTGGHIGVVEQLVASGAAFDAKGDSIWTEAFQKIEGKSFDWAGALDTRRARSSPQGLSKSQQLLARTLVVLQRSPSETKKSLDSTSIHRINNIGLEGRDRGGFLSKALFQAGVSQLLTIGIHNSSKVACLRACEIVESRKAHQSVVEHDNSGVYAAARVELTELYKLAFMHLALSINSFANTITGFLRSYFLLSDRRLEKSVQSLLDQDQRFMSAMLIANASAVSVPTTNLEFPIIRGLDGEIQRNMYELDERFIVALRDIERRAQGAQGAQGVQGARGGPEELEGAKQEEDGVHVELRYKTECEK